MDSENSKTDVTPQRNSKVGEASNRISQLRNSSNISAIGQSFRKSIRRLSSYYMANNNIIAQSIEKNNESITSDDEITQKTGNDSELRIKITENNDKDELMEASSDSSEEKKDEIKLGFWATLFTFIKLNVVAGFLFLPQGFMNGGWVFSMVAMIIIMSLNVYSMICISESSEKLNTFSLSKIGMKALKKFGFYVCEFGIAFTQICFPCSYINLTTQIFNNLINIWADKTGINYYLIIGISLGVLLIPLCLVRKIEKFSVFHLLGDLSLVATLVCLIYESIKTLSDQKDFDLSKLKMFNTGWAKLLGMGIASSEGIGLILPIKEKTAVKKDFNMIIIIGSAIVSIILVGFPFVMYMIYQDKTNEIILNNLTLKGNVYIQIILLFLLFSILIVYPVVLYPSFTIINGYLFKNVENKSSKLCYDSLVRILIVVMTIVVGIFSIGRFDTLLALVGSGICCPLSLIFPTIFHFQLFKNEQGKARNIIDLLICISGCLISLTVLIFTFV